MAGVLHLFSLAGAFFIVSFVQAPGQGDEIAPAIGLFLSFRKVS
jgi:hypothetical protein